MGPAEIRNEIRAFAQEVGSEAFVSVDFPMRGDAPLTISVYPHGLTRNCAFTIYSHSWKDLFASARAKWAELSAEYLVRLIRDMALEIIRITAEHGACVDASLREKFSFADVKQHGAAACQKADEMASNGPFSIVPAGAANAA